MLKWFRMRKPVETIERVAARPLQILDSREPALMRPVWRSPYCCTLIYFWTAVVTEDVCRKSHSDADKREALRDAFGRVVTATRGNAATALNRVLPDGHQMRRRALSDLKRVVDLYRGSVDDRYMIYADYREAVYGDGRSAVPGNRWGLRKETAHDILLASYLAGNVQTEEERALPPAASG